MALAELSWRFPARNPRGEQRWIFRLLEGAASEQELPAVLGKRALQGYTVGLWCAVDNDGKYLSEINEAGQVCNPVFGVYLFRLFLFRDHQQTTNSSDPIHPYRDNNTDLSYTALAHRW